MKIAYFDCFAGISGDMALGALVDAGADLETLVSELARLGIDEYEITSEKVVKRSIAATDVTVRLTRAAGHDRPRGFPEIKRIIEESSLPDRVKARSVAIFRRLGEAEAKIHGKRIEEIHFHEVGAMDAIVDVVGMCICLDLLGIDTVYAGAMPSFHGTVEIAHGTFPLPAPATVEILKNAPWRHTDIEGELVTPTGAAIVAELAEGFGSMPDMTVQAVGYGAGKKDFGIPNVLRIVVGEGEAPAEPRFYEDQAVRQEPRPPVEVAVLETNIDDLSPQFYELAMERLFDAGALDVYLTPIQMKKNRPATLLTVICALEEVEKMSDILFEETSTIGIRMDMRARICLPREIVTVTTKYGPISIKVARKNGEAVNIQPEYDDCKSAAMSNGVPVKMVRDTAIAAFLQGD